MRALISKATEDTDLKMTFTDKIVVKTQNVA